MTLALNRSDLNDILGGKKKFKELIESQKVLIQGNPQAFMTFMSLLDKFNFWFNIVEPQPVR